MSLLAIPSWETVYPSVAWNLVATSQDMATTLDTEEQWQLEPLRQELDRRLPEGEIITEDTHLAMLIWTMCQGHSANAA